MPGVRSKVQRQLNENIAKMEKRLVPQGTDFSHYTSLPKEGWTETQIRSELDKLESMEHVRWEDGRVSGAVYHGGKELLKLQVEAYERFCVSNPIHADVFPGVRKMEAEVVAMTLSLFNAPPSAAGVMTSGGTESILMACYSARQKAYQERGVTEPEMILPETAHAAFLKAATYFNIKYHLVTCPAPNHRVSVPAVARLINSNTVLLVGSAPNFPHGVTDDLAALSRLALRRRSPIPLHGDCCLGSFITPFLAHAGFPSAPFDFALKGVTSLSCDVHKYAFAVKGASVLLYRTRDLRTYQYFVAPDWTGGVYASPSMAGSRPGALIAATWATLVRHGEAGYLNACGKIVGARAKLETAIKEHPSLAPDLAVVGEPQGSVVAFRSGSLSVYDVADGMAARGWHLNSLQRPPAVHVAVTLPMVPAIDKQVEDLAYVVEEQKEKIRVLEAEGKGKSRSAGPLGGDMAALYGVAGSLPDKSVVTQLAEAYLDCLYKA